jgi:hypothetical protein
MRKLFCGTLAVLVLVCSSALGWGEKGHLMVNRLAVETAGSDLPEFMRAGAAQIIYDGFEPDRWREEAGSPMNDAQAPDHFFDSELWGEIATIAPTRYEFMAKLVEKKTDLAKVGYLPYAIVENHGRLRNAFRRYRNAKTPEDRESARVNAIFYAGLLGHYVADGSMPMHLSIHYNGWADGAPNPKNFTKDRMFHSRYENAYVNAAISDAQVRPLVKRPKRLGDVFGSVKAYLGQTFSEVEAIYAMEQAGEFKPEAPRPNGTAFIASQLARAATMLGDLWYTAWLESGEPVPPVPAR